MSAPDRRSRRPSEIKVYLLHVVALFRPSTAVPAFEVHQGELGDVSGWSHDDHELLIAEGRRQLDRQIADLERTRSRCQFLFTTALGLLVVVFGTARTIAGPGSHHVLPALLLWCLSIVCMVLGLLGTAALITARKDVQIIDAARFSRTTPPVLETLALAYADAVRTGENSVATALTVQRDAVLFVVAGASAYATAWLLAAVY
jgi:hypothetical protein